MPEQKQLIGEVTDYLDHIGVAIVNLSAPLKVGDTISIEGKGAQVKQRVESMQIEHKAIQTARARDSIGLKTMQPVKRGDKVYRVA